jgi:hypothetical protein
VSGFYTDPFGPSNGGDLGLGNDLNVADIGPQNNGTYGTPLTAQPTNNPSNTAGYPSDTPAWVGSLLTQGVGVLGNLGMAKMQVDYRRAEATNGGLYWQGRPAYLAGNGYGMTNQPITLSTLLLIGGLAFLLLKD